MTSNDFNLTLFRKWLGIVKRPWLRSPVGEIWNSNLKVAVVRSSLVLEEGLFLPKNALMSGYDSVKVIHGPKRYKTAECIQLLTWFAANHLLKSPLLSWLIGEFQSGFLYLFWDASDFTYLMATNIFIGVVSDGDVKSFKKFLKKWLKFKMLVWENFDFEIWMMK